MTQNEFEMLRICRSAELAYFLSEHTLDKPKFIQLWFKNKVKVDREELAAEQIHLICSEWQLKQKTFYKKYKGFIDHHNKAIQSLQFMNDQNDFTRIESFFQQMEVVGTSVLNGLLEDTEVDKEDLPQVTQGGLILIEKNQIEHFDADQNITDELTVEICTGEAKRFHFILDIIKLHGFDVLNKGKYVAGELVATSIATSANNPVNVKASSFEHDRDVDWRDELATAYNKE
jgi:hypothetical protein